MSSALQQAEPTRPQAADRRWIGLAVIALAQLMTALDATIVSIALPWAQRALGASDAERQWVITAYTLAFGGLLLVGGRIADTIGRRRAFSSALAVLPWRRSPAAPRRASSSYWSREPHRAPSRHCWRRRPSRCWR